MICFCSTFGQAHQQQQQQHNDLVLISWFVCWNSQCLSWAFDSLIQTERVANHILWCLDLTESREPAGQSEIGLHCKWCRSKIMSHLMQKHNRKRFIKYFCVYLVTPIFNVVMSDYFLACLRSSFSTPATVCLLCNKSVKLASFLLLLHRVYTDSSPVRFWANNLISNWCDEGVAFISDFKVWKLFSVFVNEKEGTLEQYLLPQACWAWLFQCYEKTCAPCFLGLSVVKLSLQEKNLHALLRNARWKDLFSAVGVRLLRTNSQGNVLCTMVCSPFRVFIGYQIGRRLVRFCTRFEVCGHSRRILNVFLIDRARFSRCCEFAYMTCAKQVWIYRQERGESLHQWSHTKPISPIFSKTVEIEKKKKK